MGLRAPHKTAANTDWKVEVTLIYSHAVVKKRRQPQGQPLRSGPPGSSHWGKKCKNLFDIAAQAV